MSYTPAWHQCHAPLPPRKRGLMPEFISGAAIVVHVDKKTAKYRHVHVGLGSPTSINFVHYHGIGIAWHRPDRRTETQNPKQTPWHWTTFSILLILFFLTAFVFKLSWGELAEYRLLSGGNYRWHPLKSWAINRCLKSSKLLPERFQGFRHFQVSQAKQSESGRRDGEAGGVKGSSGSPLASKSLTILMRIQVKHTHSGENRRWAEWILSFRLTRVRRGTKTTVNTAS